MKHIPKISHILPTGFCLGLMLLLSFANDAMSAQSTGTNTSAAAASDSESAWKEVQKALRPPMPPAEWQGQPTPEQRQAFRQEQGKAAGEAADKCKDYYTRFPNAEHAEAARKKEYEMLQIAIHLGNTNKMAALEKLEQAKLADPNLSEDERLRLRSEAIQRRVMAKYSESQQAALAEEEKGAREIIKEFPDKSDGYRFLLSVAEQSEGPKNRELANEIIASKAPKEAKTTAEGLLKKLDALGKPLDIKFTALDKREVDLSKMKGKVVLLDFWATWCPPCVAEIPNVKKAYEKLHPKGFEIVGISFDSDQSKLEKFVAKEEMKWPQYFDGKQWQNEYGQKYGINSIPAMWLVDKKGNLSDMNARGGLEEKVEKLLAD